jgi:PAS domain-containing protein
MIAPADAASSWARRVAALRTQAAMRNRDGAAPNDLTETVLSACEALVRELAGAQLTRDQLRADLRVADAAWDHLFDVIPSACVLTDSAGVILRANRAASTLLNMSATHLKRRELLVFSQDRETFRALLAELNRNPGAELRARLMVRPRERKQTMTQLHVLPAPGRDPAWLWVFTPAAAADTTPFLEVASPPDDGLAPFSDSL